MDYLGSLVLLCKDTKSRMHKETQDSNRSRCGKEDKNGTEIRKGFVSLVRIQLGSFQCTRAILVFMFNISEKSSVPDPQGPPVIPDSANNTLRNS